MQSYCLIQLYACEGQMGVAVHLKDCVSEHSKAILKHLNLGPSQCSTACRGDSAIGHSANFKS